MKKDENIKHIVSFSGGKDSTAMLLMLIERERESNFKIDEIVFCDTEKEFPEMYHHIDKVEEYINRPIIRLKPKPRHNFDYLMFEHIKTKGKNKGQKGYGWALSNVRWCTSKLKEDIIRKYLKKYKNNYIECIGIAFDELERCNLEDSKKKYPLVEWKITEGEALKYCYDKGFNWDGLYTRFDRVSCWCCPFINLKELRNLYMFYPDLWNELKNMDNRSFNSFRSSRTKDGLKLISVQNLEDRFKEEIEKVGLKI